MVNLVVILLSVLLPLVHLSLTKAAKTPHRVIHLLLLYALVFDVGIVGLIFGFLPHGFFADETAKLIGWRPGSRFSVRSVLSRRRLGAFWASYVFGSVARFGLRPGLDGPSS